MQENVSNSEIRDLDALVKPSLDDRSRLANQGLLHSHCMLEMRFNGLQETYDEIARPAFIEKHNREPKDGVEIARAMKDTNYFKFYSAIRYNSQELAPLIRQSFVKKVLPELIEEFKRIRDLNPTGGTLRLDPDLEMPKYYTSVDVHLVPGNFHVERNEDDVFQGVVQGRGLSSTGGKNRAVKIRNFAGVGDSISYYLKQRFPDFKPKSVLDMGTQGGMNLLGYIRQFPGIEAHGIDLAAPNLRYGFAKAEYEGIPMHFSQQNAEDTDFEDGKFDLIVSSFFLHEIPVPITRNVLKEALRLLSPGGILCFMELPAHKLCDPMLNFQYDWDAKNNNEPFFSAFRAQDPAELLTTAGFPADTVFELEIPDVTTFDMSKYDKFMSGEIKAPLHGRGGWNVFGAVKK